MYSVNVFVCLSFCRQIFLTAYAFVSPSASFGMRVCLPICSSLSHRLRKLVLAIPCHILSPLLYRIRLSCFMFSSSFFMVSFYAPYFPAPRRLMFLLGSHLYLAGDKKVILHEHSRIFVYRAYFCTCFFKRCVTFIELTSLLVCSCTGDLTRISQLVPNRNNGTDLGCTLTHFQLSVTAPRGV